MYRTGRNSSDRTDAVAENGASRDYVPDHASPASPRPASRSLVADVDTYRQTFQSLPVTMALLDGDGRIIDVNERWREFAAENGGDPDGAIGTNYLDACHDPNDPEALAVESMLRELLAGERDVVEYEYPCHCPGLRRWYLMQAYRYLEGSAVGIMVLHLDVTRWRLAEEAEHDRADTDPLTGLLNRGAFNERAEQSLAVAAETGGNVAVLFIDMDYYKVINDAYGHELGDQVLVSVAERLRGPMREHDVLARYGGDEFVVIAEGAGQASAERLAKRLREAIADPIAVGEYRFQVSCSQGIAIYPDHGRDLASLVCAADTAMYRAKRGGGGGTAFAA